MRRQAPLIVACTATFLLLAYTTVVTVAMPAIAADLDTDFGALQWVIGVYTTALAALLVPLGVIGDRFGRRSLLAWSLVAFAAASLGCALAPSVAALVAGRLVQGVAAAALFATTLPLLDASYSGREKHRAFAIWGAVSGMAAAVGNVSGGLLSALGWRTIFAIAVPVALGAALLAVRFLPRDRPSAGAPLNGVSMALLGASVGGLVVASLVFSERGASPVALGALVACAALCAAFVARERRSPATALFSGELVRNPVFRVATLVAAAYYFAAFGCLPAIAAWLQGPAGLTPVATSLVLSVQPIVFFAVSGLLGARLGAARRGATLTAGLVLCAAGCLAIALPAAVPTWWGVLPAMVLTGIGAGIISPVLPAAVMQGVPAAETGVSSSAVNAARQLGISLGVAACATVVRVGAPGSQAGASAAASTGWSGVLWAIALLTAGVCSAAAVATAVGLRGDRAVA